MPERRIASKPGDADWRNLRLCIAVPRCVRRQDAIVT
jgi:hypothetical protein